ncbi:MAG: hypothetical protein KF752_05985 [Pirellulaceae bacterium]|nr:hypothetical protein [Pirellulaceae bacterium]
MTGTHEKLTRRKIPAARPAGRHRAWPAWLLSGIVHSSILTLLTLWWTSGPQGTFPGETGRPVGIAIAYDNADQQAYYHLTGVDEQSPADSDAGSLAALSSITQASPAEQQLLDGLLAAVDGGGAEAAGDLGLGQGKSQLPQGGKPSLVKTQVFGIEGQGSRFIYVFDRSDSMNGFAGKPLGRAKAELLSSLESLGETHQFQIIFYNDTPLPYGGLPDRGPQLLRGDNRTKELATRFVREMTASGGTNHIDSLRMALAMGPDVVFFLTDADYPVPPARDLDNIVTRAARSGTTIHCIQFGDGVRSTRSGWIAELAAASGGQFRYVDVSQF